MLLAFAVSEETVQLGIMPKLNLELFGRRKTLFVAWYCRCGISSFEQPLLHQERSLAREQDSAGS